MRILLDTNVLIWALGNARELPDTWRTLLLRPSNEVWVSSVSLTEIAVKATIGKLPEPSGSLSEVASRLGFQDLPFGPNHADALLALPLHHRDPFDRMLIAQAVVEDVAIMTSDAQFSSYDVRLVSP